MIAGLQALWAIAQQRSVTSAYLFLNRLNSLCCVLE